MDAPAVPSPFGTVFLAKLSQKNDFCCFFSCKNPVHLLFHTYNESFPLIFMHHPYISIEEEIEHDMLRWKEILQGAEETVRDRGWSECDEDFKIQIEEEAKNQWKEDWEREYRREREREEELLLEEIVRQRHQKHSPMRP